MMSYLLIRQRFTDYTRWRAAFDALAETRASVGISTVLVTRNSQDTDEAVVLFEFSDPAKVREHFGSGALRTAHQQGGVLEGSTQATFLELAPDL